jgi:hypothetical protein
MIARYGCYRFLSRSELAKQRLTFNRRKTGGRNNAIGPPACLFNVSIVNGLRWRR